MPQTTIQKSEAIKFGSTLLEVGDSFSALTNLGAIRDMVFNSKVENIEINFDNTASIKRFKDGQKASFTCLLAEVDMTTFSIIDAGLVVQTTVAGSLVSGATQVVASGAWGYDNPIVVANQNGDGSLLTINSVTGATDGALVEGTDYFVGQDALGRTVVTIIDSATVTTPSQNMTIDYDYTPNASKKLTFNDFGSKTLKVARITNTDENGDQFIIDLTSVTNITPISMPFLADDADDVMTVEVELEGLVSSITDEQSTV